ncbi:hypothetical protein JCM33374_g2909 [Metschnikowia sp. JCM 33374]|nr:hypothetical protein JCM33374_g2909 [Metschnikowia sp. JCM 33374]
MRSTQNVFTIKMATCPNPKYSTILTLKLPQTKPTISPMIRLSPAVSLVTLVASFVLANAINQPPLAFANISVISFPLPHIDRMSPSQPLFIESIRIDSESETPFAISFEKFQEKLDQFIMGLKDFIHDTIFEHEEFRFSARILAERLANLRWNAQWVSPWSYDFLVSLIYAEKMFRFMLDSAVLMDFYRMDAGMARRLIYKAIQLNVRLLKLYDAHGEPDPTIPEYSETVTRSFELLETWNELFNNIERQPHEIIVTYFSQVNHAEITLFHLKDAIVF